LSAAGAEGGRAGRGVRTKAPLGYGIAHFIVYVGVVLTLAHFGLTAVGGAVIRTLFLGSTFAVVPQR
jgi:hypothetical protein